jgi:hypothetical protein
MPLWLNKPGNSTRGGDEKWEERREKREVRSENEEGAGWCGAVR